jgi:alkylated DNA repair dioxygenase AlkB
VAWHGDRIARERPDSIVATVSLGGPRRFLIRPKGGGTSTGFDLGRGDLVVMGGACQRLWEHTIPKTASAPPRIALMFRHAYD